MYSPKSDDDDDSCDAEDHFERSYDKKKSTSNKKRKRFRELERLYSQTYRATLSDEKKQRQNELSKLRMRKYREKQKTLPKKTLSSAQKKELRAKWRAAKRKQRMSLTPNKKSELARRKLQRSIDKLAPAQFAELLQHTTPRKKAYLKQRGIYNSPYTKRENTVARSLFLNVLKKNSELRKTTHSENRAKQKIITKFCDTNIFGIKAHTLKNQVRRKIIKTAFAVTGMESDVAQFYGDYSRSLPIQRQAGKSTKHIYTVNKTAFVSCLCDSCLNIDYLVSYSNRINTTHLILCLCYA